MSFVVCFVIVFSILAISAIVRFGNMHMLRKYSSVGLKKQISLEYITEKLSESINAKPKSMVISNKNSLCDCMTSYKSQIKFPPVLKIETTIASTAFAMFKTIYDEINAKSRKKFAISSIIQKDESMIVTLAVLLILIAAITSNVIIMNIGTIILCVTFISDLSQVSRRISAGKKVMKFCRNEQILDNDEKDAFCGMMTVFSFSSLANFADITASFVLNKFKRPPAM